jgi:hypothetical protein
MLAMLKIARNKESPHKQPWPNNQAYAGGGCLGGQTRQVLAEFGAGLDGNGIQNMREPLSADRNFALRRLGVCLEHDYCSASFNRQS